MTGRDATGTSPTPSALVALAGPLTGARVLDAACGTCFATLAAARAVGPRGHVVGVDISAAMLAGAETAIAASGLANVEVRRADAVAVDEPDASFDLVLCSAGLLYLPVPDALREWQRLLAAGGHVGFSTMRAGHPVAAHLFREHARRAGLSLADPAAGLGEPARCRAMLESAGFGAVETVEETVEFSRADLEHAWDAHVRGVHHDVAAALTPAGLDAFRRAYTRDLAERLDADEAGVRTAGVIYAFGRKPAS